jgi:SAM-dependent methyltransferase
MWSIDLLAVGLLLSLLFLFAHRAGQSGKGRLGRAGADMSIRRPCVPRLAAISITAISITAIGILAIAAVPGLAQEKPYQPVPGQAGKDAVWVPTPFNTVETMLDVAKVTPEDIVIDLGSGDGRKIIAAARRGARAIGVEFEDKLVQLSREQAEKEGVADKASFVQGDMFAYDISQATVLPLFLLPEHFTKLMPKFLALRPGTRIVINTYRIPKWKPDQVVRVEDDCFRWCTVNLYIVPAKVEGTWRSEKGELTLVQDFQKISGTLSVDGERVPISDGRLRGDTITFMVGRTQYTGRVDGDTITAEVSGDSEGQWKAVRQQQPSGRDRAQTGG